MHAAPPFPSPPCPPTLFPIHPLDECLLTSPCLSICFWGPQPKHQKPESDPSKKP